MASLCPEPEQYLLDNPDVKLSSAGRNKLASYDPDSQMRWLTNPMMEWILQSYMNQLLSSVK